MNTFDGKADGAAMEADAAENATWPGYVPPEKPCTEHHRVVSEEPSAIPLHGAHAYGTDAPSFNEETPRFFDLVKPKVPSKEDGDAVAAVDELVEPTPTPTPTPEPTPTPSPSPVPQRVKPTMPECTEELLAAERPCKTVPRTDGKNDNTLVDAVKAQQDKDLGLPPVLRALQQ